MAAVAKTPPGFPVVTCVLEFHFLFERAQPLKVRIDCKDDQNAIITQKYAEIIKSNRFLLKLPIRVYQVEFFVQGEKESIAAALIVNGGYLALRFFSDGNKPWISRLPAPSLPAPIPANKPGSGE